MRIFPKNHYEDAISVYDPRQTFPSIKRTLLLTGFVLNFIQDKPPWNFTEELFSSTTSKYGYTVGHLYVIL